MEEREKEEERRERKRKTKTGKRVKRKRKGGWIGLNPCVLRFFFFFKFKLNFFKKKIGFIYLWGYFGLFKIN